MNLTVDKEEVQKMVELLKKRKWSKKELLKELKLTPMQFNSVMTHITEKYVVAEFDDNPKCHYYKIMAMEEYE